MKVSFDLLAQALLAERPDAEQQDRVLAELEAVHEALRDPEAKRILDPAWPMAERSEALAGALSSLDPAVKNACRVLLEQGSLAQLGEWIEQVRRERERQGLARSATVTSSAPLTKEEASSLKKQLEKKWGMHVTMSFRTDPSLIGGLQIASGDWFYDASVKGRLQRLTQALTH